MNRRDFIRYFGVGLGSLSGISSLSFGEPIHSNDRAHDPFIVVFLRGGADGLGILSPLDDSDFIAARPPQMRFEPTASPLLHQGTSFYWHPSAEPLSQLNQMGRLLPWTAVGISNETRSHFEAQEIIERGANQLHGLADNLGVMARIAQSESPQGNSHDFLFAGSTTVPRAFQGGLSSIAIRDLQRGIDFPGGQEQLDLVQAIARADQQHPASKAMRETLAYLGEIQHAIISADRKIKPYQSAGQTPYPNSDPGVGLRSIARLLSAGIRLRYAWVDQGGWDMHENQPGRLNTTLGQLSTALLAFDQDMQAQQRAYRMIVITEFGRRFRSNSSNGTDHGHGSLALVLGAGLPGGKLWGDWPGLSENALDRGVDLAVTTPYQRVFEKALQWSFNA